MSAPAANVMTSARLTPAALSSLAIESTVAPVVYMSSITRVTLIQSNNNPSSLLTICTRRL